MGIFDNQKLCVDETRLKILNEIGLKKGQGYNKAVYEYDIAVKLIQDKKIIWGKKRYI